MGNMPFAAIFIARTALEVLMFPFRLYFATGDAVAQLDRLK